MKNVNMNQWDNLCLLNQVDIVLNVVNHIKMMEWTWIDSYTEIPAELLVTECKYEDKDKLEKQLISSIKLQELVKESEYD